MKVEQHDYDLIHKVKLLWLFGNWTALVDIDLPKDDSILSCYKAAALFQVNRVEEAKFFLKNSVFDKEFLLKLLVSGIYNNLARSKAVLNFVAASDDDFVKSLTIVDSALFDESIARARKAEQLSQLKIHHRWLSISENNSIRKKNKLFIDCGGHDGCSVIKFLLMNPDYDVISFEANPELWPYYSDLPTQLIKKAVYDYDGEVEFIIDPIDADGSSLIKDKKIDFNNEINNEDCPRIIVPCIDLSKFISAKSEIYDEIVLKLDVEGAEYSILNKMLKDNSVSLISHLYAEFHWHKIGLDKNIHDELIDNLKSYVEISYWDANSFSVHGKKDRFFESRDILKGVLF